MPSRSAAERDLAHARRAREAGDHEWACFAAHQAAEKAIKAVHQAQGNEAWGHTLHVLLRDLGEDDEAVVNRAKRLDRHYIPTRYPNGFEAGAPMDFYTDEDAAKAVEDAGALIARCQGLLGRR